MSKRDLTRGLKALAGARPAYEEADDYYTGEIAEFFSNKAIRRALTAESAATDRFRYNFAAIPVDRLADRWRPGALKGKNETITNLLEEWWHANTLDEDLDGYLRESAKLGDYFVTVWPDDNDEDVIHAEGEEAPAIPITSVEVFGNSPLFTRLIYSRENSRKAVFAIRVWAMTKADADGNDVEHIRVNLSYVDKIEQWISVGKADAENLPTGAGSFELYEDDDEEGDEPGELDNPWGVIPVFHFRVGSKPYGTPVHRRGYGPQDALNKIIGTHMSTIDQLGIPQRYGRIDPAASLAADNGGEIFGDDANSQTRPTKKESRLKAGQFWYLEGLAEVGQFEAAGPDPFLKPAEFAVRAMATLTGTPLSDFGFTEGTGPTSGEAKRREASAQIARAEKERVGLGRVVEAMAEFALKIAGFEGEKVNFEWLPADIATDKEGIELVGAKVDAGVPLQIALAEAGYTADEIAEWWPEGSPAIPPIVVSKIATALQALGAAKTLGAGSLSDEDIRGMLPGVFMAARTEADRIVKSTVPEVDPEKLAADA